MGLGTAVAVAGASICLLGVIAAQLVPALGVLIGIVGVVVSFAGVADENEDRLRMQPPGRAGP